MAALRSDYEAEFGLAPGFRAGLQAGPVIVSECGDAKRLLAFSATRRTSPRGSAKYCKAINARLVTSGDLCASSPCRRLFTLGEMKTIAVRGREEPTEAMAVEKRA